jgi:hypothetical protein
MRTIELSIEDCTTVSFKLAYGQVIEVYLTDVKSYENTVLVIRAQNERTGLLVRPAPFAVAAVEVSTEVLGFTKSEYRNGTYSKKAI